MIQGFRRYRLNPLNQIVGRFGATWDKADFTAECLVRHYGGVYEGDRKDLAFQHLSNDFPCKCGIYITKTHKAHESTQDEENYNVEAVVTGWGAYAEYDDGWKVQFARIERMTLFSSYPDDNKIATFLQETYNVPVSFVTDYRPCCMRQHTKKYYKNSNGIDVPICKLTDKELVEIIEIVYLMGSVSFALAESAEIINELVQRKVHILS